LTDAGDYDWDYEGSTKTTYPKIDALDFATIYPTYFIKTFHYIDKGKIITIVAEADPLFVLELNTVVSTASSEGFRPIYKFYYQDEWHYGILNEYSTNGKLGIYKLTLII
jgi:hypothetical protein